MTLRLHAANPALPLPADSKTGDPGRYRLEEEIVSLFDQFRDPLLRYLSSLGVAFPDGEEVIQETFLALFQHLRAGKPRHHLRGWLFRVAHNLALKERYRSRRSESTLSELGAQPGLAVDKEPDPEERLATKMAQHRLQAVVKALAETDRHCLFLRAEGLRYREIAQILDISLGSVSLSLARSLARIASVSER
jgi:RNA polymerase sigma-70 factor (ECF subfamily)